MGESSSPFRRDARHDPARPPGVLGPILGATLHATSHLIPTRNLAAISDARDEAETLAEMAATERELPGAHAIHHREVRERQGTEERNASDRTHGRVGRRTRARGPAGHRAAAHRRA